MAAVGGVEAEVGTRRRAVVEGAVIGRVVRGAGAVLIGVVAVRNQRDGALRGVAAVPIADGDDAIGAVGISTCPIFRERVRVCAVVVAVVVGMAPLAAVDVPRIVHARGGQIESPHAASAPLPAARAADGLLVVIVGRNDQMIAVRVAELFVQETDAGGTAAAGIAASPLNLSSRELNSKFFADAQTI